MSHCPTCGKFILFPNGHSCPPAWEVRDADDCEESDWVSVREYDAADAAESYAKASDDSAGDGPQVRSVLVRAAGSSEVKRFHVTFDYSVDYRVWEDV